MADIKGSVKATDLNLQGTDSLIEAEGTMSLTGPSILIQNLHYPSNDGASGQVLTTDGAGALGWTTGTGTGATNLNDLLDVTVVTPAQDDVLAYNNISGQWENSPPSVGSFGLNDLIDTTIDTPLAEEVLFYNGSFWVNYQPGITNLSDVDTTTNPAQENNVLIHKTDTWVPGVATLPGDNISTLTNDSAFISDITLESLGSLADVDITTVAPTNDQVLSWNGTNWVPKTDLTMDISAKADKIIPATTGDFASLGADGNLTDSGSSASDFATAAHTHVKADITDFSDGDYATAAQGATADTALQSITAESIGDLTDVDITTVAPITNQVLSWNGTSWVPKTDIVTDTSDKADKMVPATTGDFASLGADGNLTDSGSSASDFATSAQGATADTATQPGDGVSTLANDANYLTGDITTTSPAEGNILAYNDTPELVPATRVNWTSAWDGTVRKKDDMVIDGHWTMIARRETTEKPAPQPNGQATYALSDTPTWVSGNNTSVVVTGHDYTFLEGGWLKSIRVWVPAVTADTHYRFEIIDTTIPGSPIVRTLPEPILRADAWSDLATGAFIVTAGTKIRVLVDALNSGSNTTVTGGWTYGGDTKNDPATGGWNRDKHNVLKFDKTDADSTDRTTELLGVTAGSTILTANTADVSEFWEYLVDSAPTDGGTYVEYEVTRIANGDNLGGGDITTVTMTIPIPQSTEYVTENNYWPTNTPDYATISGFKEYDGVDQPGNELSSFGVDLQFQRASVSEDWDYVSSSEFNVTTESTATPVLGDTESRPVVPALGTTMFDTDLGIPIWWNGTNWVNATGTIV